MCCFYFCGQVAWEYLVQYGQVAVGFWDATSKYRGFLAITSNYGSVYQINKTISENKGVSSFCSRIRPSSNGNQISSNRNRKFNTVNTLVRHWKRTWVTSIYTPYEQLTSLRYIHTLTQVHGHSERTAELVIVSTKALHRPHDWDQNMLSMYSFPRKPKHSTEVCFVRRW
jgi:hypothetical protein